MAELNGHNTRKSQFLVIACIMPIFVFSNDLQPFHTGKEDLLNKKITIASVGNEHIENLLSEQKGIFYTLLQRITELHSQSLAEKKGGE